MMKKLVIASVVLALAAPAYAQMTWFLTKQWNDKGNRFCQYGNGTVLNVGARICPLSIKG